MRTPNDVRALYFSFFGLSIQKMVTRTTYWLQKKLLNRRIESIHGIKKTAKNEGKKRKQSRPTKCGYFFFCFSSYVRAGSRGDPKQWYALAWMCRLGQYLLQIYTTSWIICLAWHRALALNISSFVELFIYFVIIFHIVLFRFVYYITTCVVARSRMATDYLQWIRIINSFFLGMRWSQMIW